MNTTSAPAIRSAVHEGAFWLFVGSGGQKFFGLLSGVALARLLAPRDFGAFALAAFSYELANLFSGLGAAQYVVAAREPERHLDAAFRLNLAMAVGLAVLLVAFGPVAAAFFHEPRLPWLIAGLAAALPLGAIGAVQGALLDRELRLGAVARRRMAVNLGGVVVTVLLAAFGAGVWALVIPVPLKSLATSWFNLRLHAWRPSRARHTEGARQVFDYGRHILGTKIAGFLTHQLDNAVVGRVLGATSLGLYDFAYQAAMMPLRWGGDITTRLAFPALASQARRDESARRAESLRAPETEARGRDERTDDSAFLTACGWIAFTAAPVVTGLVIVAPDWVRVLYGPKWEATIPLIRTLAPAAFAVLLARPAMAWLQANGREAWPARVQIATLPLFAVALALTVPRGIGAVAAGMAAVLTLQSALLVVAALRAGAASWVAWARSLWSGLLPSLIMAAVLWPAAGWIGRAPVAGRLGALIGIGLAVFVGVSMVLSRERWRELVALLRQGRRRS